MIPPEERLRPHPSTRLAGPVVELRFAEFARMLREEPAEAKEGHRQTGLIHRGALRVLLFTFEPGGRLPEHQAPGQILIHCLRGELMVSADGGNHRISAGEAVAIDPDVSHSVEALAQSEMLLTVCKVDP